jgi:SAM-dependent methyltransferase
MRSAADYGVPMVSAGAPNLHYSRRLRRRISKSRHQILNALNHTTPGPLLDVGCALGYTLQAARTLGLAACGVEIDEAAVKFCRAQGFDVQVGTLTHMPFEAGRFQIITMKHVLEHTPDPLMALAEVRRLLKPGGALFIAVPHAGYRKAADANGRGGRTLYLLHARDPWPPARAGRLRCRTGASTPDPALSPSVGEARTVSAGAISLAGPAAGHGAGTAQGILAGGRAAR